MRTLTTIFIFLFALNVTAVAHAGDGSMLQRQMVEKLREQNKKRREARERKIEAAEAEKNAQNTGGASATPDNR